MPTYKHRPRRYTQGSLLQHLWEESHRYAQSYKGSRQVRGARFAAEVGDALYLLVNVFRQKPNDPATMLAFRDVCEFLGSATDQICKIWYNQISPDTLIYLDEMFDEEAILDLFGDMVRGGSYSDLEETCSNALAQANILSGAATLLPNHLRLITELAQTQADALMFDIAVQGTDDESLDPEDVQSTQAFVETYLMRRDPKADLCREALEQLGKIIECARTYVG